MNTFCTAPCKSRARWSLKIEVLPAGNSLLWTQGGGRRRRYWCLNFSAEPMKPSEAVDLTRRALDDSIRRHFVSDVPVGIFLSGGIDSTALVALARSNGYDNLKTMCISFDDPKLQRRRFGRGNRGPFWNRSLRLADDLGRRP